MASVPTLAAILRGVSGAGLGPSFQLGLMPAQSRIFRPTSTFMRKYAYVCDLAAILYGILSPDEAGTSSAKPAFGHIQGRPTSKERKQIYLF